MTVSELIDELVGFDGDAEVRFLAQPSRPFEYTIAAVVEATRLPGRPERLPGDARRARPARRGPAGLLWRRGTRLTRPEAAGSEW